MGPSRGRPKRWARFAAALALLASVWMPVAADSSASSEASIQPDAVSLLSGNDWRLGSFPFGAGEKEGAYRPEYNASGFRPVAVPGEVQRQVGLQGMDLYQQGREPTLVNQKEWWYRKSFMLPPAMAGKTLRLVFDGVDYFSTVWLNGSKLGEHEGAYVPFEYDVTSMVKRDGPNQLTVKVTCPWLPDGRGFLEYMKGELAEAVPGTVTEFPAVPFVLGPTWDGLPAGGNAVFPMGLFRDVELVSSGEAVVADLAVSTKSVNADGSATLRIYGTVMNYGRAKLRSDLAMKLAPDNFSGEALTLPTRTIELTPGETTFEQEAIVARPQLWWTWDTGEQNLYRATARLATSDPRGGAAREVVFGIRTIERHPDMSYWLNGRRLFLKGAWYPMSDLFGSKPTPETYEADLELFRAANLNHLVNFTLVEKPEFYDLCDRLGILNFFEFPLTQFGPMAVMDHSNPRREVYVKEALAQVRQIIIAHRNHPSIVVWAPFAEAQIKGKGWGAAGHNFDQYDYQEFADRIGAMVAELAPGTIFHPSFCDAGEQHYWAGTAGPWRTTPYQEQFQANTGFVSEYGSIAMPALESLEKMLPPDELWSERNRPPARWYGLPVDVAAYSYQTSFDYIGLAGMLDRIERFVDTDVKSAAELVDDSQLYQAFLLQYSTEVFRRRKYNSINGTRVWAYLEPAPRIGFGVVDYFRVPKMGYYFLKRAQARWAVNFAYEDALESQVAGKRLSIPVWLVNDHPRSVPYELHGEITNLQEQVLWRSDFSGEIAADSTADVGTVDWQTPEAPGIYVLQASARERGGPLQTSARTFIKVAPRLFSSPMRMLLIGERAYCQPIASMAEGIGLEVRVIDEASIQDLSLLDSPDELRGKFDLVWLASFDSFWKLLHERAAEGLKQAVHDGLGFIHSGGPGSFHGGSIRAALLNLTPLADILPVRLLERDDLLLGAPPLAGYDKLMETAPIRNLRLAPGAPPDWAIPSWNEEGLPGMNRVLVKPNAAPLVMLDDFPLVVTGRFGKGHTVAFAGFTPKWSERRSPWDRKMKSPYHLDQELAADPQFRTFFALALRMIASATGKQPGTPDAELAASHRLPLFETLQNLPVADVTLPSDLKLTATGDRARGTVTIRNGANYARLVRLGLKWGGPPDKAPYLVLFGDNYFDLLPGEEAQVSLDVRLRKGSKGTFEGQLSVEGSNLGPTAVPIAIKAP